jgi:hypothetical protein
MGIRIVMSMRPLSICAACAAFLLALVLSVGEAVGDESPGPSCAQGPEVAGDTIIGTPCADVIVAPPGVAAVEGGEGDDTIVPSPVIAAVPCTPSVCLGIGSQTFDGGPGDDVVYGERGNDRLNGGGGNDQVFGGIGDDLLRGGPGEDPLPGGFGVDSIDRDPTIECGDGADTALIDHPSFGDVAAADCEDVREGDPNSFRIETQFPLPEPPAEQPAVDPVVGPGPNAKGDNDPTVSRERRPQRTCLGVPSGGEPHCSQRPHRVGVGALGLVNRLHWRHWGSRRSVGVGHLTVSGGCCDPGISARAKVKASRLESCDSRRWYTRLAVHYGRGYGKTYVRGYPSPTPCV